jgi:hypothetical protein
MKIINNYNMSGSGRKSLGKSITIICIYFHKKKVLKIKNIYLHLLVDKFMVRETTKYLMNNTYTKLE